MSPTIEMIAHCIFHQTPVRERATCGDCHGELRFVNGDWYCPTCLRQCDIEPCPICTGRPWNDDVPAAVEVDEYEAAALRG